MDAFGRKKKKVDVFMRANFFYKTIN